jgi:hypothetical protein
MLFFGALSPSVGYIATRSGLLVDGVTALQPVIVAATVN